jgi:ribose 1,5-bisphosphate isomerase
MDPHASKIICDIKKLRIQSAHGIARAGLECLKICISSSKAGDRKSFLEEITGHGKRIKTARPTEIELGSIINLVLLKISQNETEDVESLKVFALSVCDKQIAETEVAMSRLIENGAKQIHNGDRVLTHCHSRTVVGIFREAKKQGKDFTVFVTETRPLKQGLITAKDLLASNIKIVYGVDSDMGFLMKKCTKVLVGCDAILPDGSIVNKIGTLPMAIVAKAFGKPFIVAGLSSKLTHKVEIEERDPHEVEDLRKLHGTKLKVINPAFDVTPGDYVDFIITEKGIVKPHDIFEMVRE